MLFLACLADKMCAKVETGVQLLARLGTRPCIKGISPILHDGPNPCDVLELYGSEGTGKTEFLLSLVTSIIIPKEWKGYNLKGVEASVIFIDTDYKFQILRLVNLIEKKITKCIEDENRNKAMPAVSPDDIENLVKECLRRLIIIRCTSSFQLLITLHSLETVVSNNPDIVVLMVDSISAYYWLDRCSGGENVHAQEKNMKLIVEQLTKLVNSYSLVLFATKSENFKKTSREKNSHEDEDNSRSGKTTTDHAEFLCKTWHKFVKHRFIFSKQHSFFNICCHDLNVDVKFVIDDSGFKFV